MRRPIILGGNPYVADVYRKDAESLFNDTGGNTGNLAFLYALATHLPSSTPILHWGASPEQVRAAGDILVLPLANQLGSHTNLEHAAERLSLFNLPVLGIGLGAQADAQSVDVTLQDGTMNWLRALAEGAPSANPNVGVRGAYTKGQIERFGFDHTSVVTGCPSNFINTSDDIGARVAEGFGKRPERIAVMAGIPFIPKLGKLEQELSAIVTATGGAYIVQHGLEMLRLARNEFDLLKPETLELCRSYIAPSLSLSLFRSWCRQYAYAFYDARMWMDFVTRFDFVVGTRFHGAMLAIQAGVPAACITHDSRTQEMCETMGIPSRHYTEIDVPLTKDNVMDFFSFDPEKYRSTRSDLLRRYVGIYQDAEVPTAQGLKNLVKMS